MYRNNSVLHQRTFLLTGLVDASSSTVVKISSRVKRLVRNEVVVQLMDSFSNPAASYRERLSFKFGDANFSGFLTWAFSDNGDGTYTGYYLAKDLGVFNLSVLFDDKILSPSPVQINIYESKLQNFIVCNTHHINEIASLQNAN